MKLTFFLIFFLTIIFFKAQNFNEYDKILKIENLKFNNHEIRVYKKYVISTGLELFRFYQDEKENWKAEFYEITTSGEEKNIKIRVRKSKLNSFKNFELLWIQILDTNVSYLPQWKFFNYKLKKHNKDYEILDGEITSSNSMAKIMDGVSYSVKIKNGENYNEFAYSNPESYLEIYPDVDELISFKELLNVLRSEFKIFAK